MTSSVYKGKDCEGIFTHVGNANILGVGPGRTDGLQTSDQVKCVWKTHLHTYTSGGNAKNIVWISSLKFDYRTAHLNGRFRLVNWSFLQTVISL